jgi:cytochrome c2
MAMDMLKAHPSAMQTIAATAVQEGADAHMHADHGEDAPTMHADCSGHTPSSSHDSTPKCGEGSCNFCQICHTLAAATSTQQPPLLWACYTQPYVASAQYVSATTAQLLKPPIS